MHKAEVYPSSVEISPLKHGIDKSQRILLYVRIRTAAKNIQCVHDIIYTGCHHFTVPAELLVLTPFHCLSLIKLKLFLMKYAMVSSDQC